MPNEAPHGTYIDSEKFTYHCFFHKKYKKWVIAIRNPKGQHCSSGRYTKAQATEHLKGFEKLY